MKRETKVRKAAASRPAAENGSVETVVETPSREALDIPVPTDTDTPAPSANVPSPETAPHLVGNLDTISDQVVSGWMMVKDDPRRRCIVLLKEGERLIGRTVASFYRADLEQSGHGDGCYGFQIEMPRSLLDGEPHRLSVIEQDGGLTLADRLEWRSTGGTAEARLKETGAAPGASPLATDTLAPVGRASSAARPIRHGKSLVKGPAGTMHLLFDMSDLVYYIGHHPNLTGIQRVQSSIVLAMCLNGMMPLSSVTFLSFNPQRQQWMAIPQEFFLRLLQDLFQPETERSVSFNAMEARIGMLPGAREFAGSGLLDAGTPSVLCLLGAAWVQQDYFNRVLSLKRQYGTRFVMTAHDLIPIYARETCDQGTARVFEGFLRRALRHVDHFLCVSENTAQDLRRFAKSLARPEPTLTVTRNGSSFEEFLAAKPESNEPRDEDLPERFVLFVSTIEGRKNHKLILDIWQRMIAEGMDPPQLICVGRIGWRADGFVSQLIESNYLDGHVRLLQEISDAQLDQLYRHCMFTVYPSFYEGWGLPVGESLALGKICVTSRRSSIPEVAGDLGVYLEIENAEQSYQTVHDLITDEVGRLKLEEEIRRRYVAITWKEVAGGVLRGCEDAVAKDWEEPYPTPCVPYSVEISFARREQEGIDNAIGPELLNRIADARRGHFLQESLREENFLIAEDIRGPGHWGEPEAWGTWLCHQEGELLLGLPADDSTQCYAFLRLRTIGPIATSRISFSANGETVWAGVIGDRSKNVILRIRRHGMLGGRGWKLRLRVRVEATPEQLAQVGELDRRLPLIGFERMIVVPENDIKTRLDVLGAMVC